MGYIISICFLILAYHYREKYKHFKVFCEIYRKEANTNHESFINQLRENDVLTEKLNEEILKRTRDE